MEIYYCEQIHKKRLAAAKRRAHRRWYDLSGNETGQAGQTRGEHDVWQT